MEKERVIELWQEKMAGDISTQDEKTLDAYLLKDEQLASELKEMEQTWSLFEEIERPEPSVSMDARFDGMMAAYSESVEKKPSQLALLMEQVSKTWQMGLASLVIGLFIGWWALPSQTQKEDIQVLSSEIQSMKEMMMLTLIEQPKAQERIRAVNLAAELPSADQKVINALIATLNQDENLNVRLASLESLTRYADQAEVRQALVDALKMQDSPLMLVAIADVLVQIQATSSLKTMQELIESTEDQIVKEKLKQSVQTLRQS